MTEEEAFALMEHYTGNPPRVDPSKARIRIPMVRVDSTTAEYLVGMGKKTQKRPEEIIGNMIREQIALQSTS